MSYSLNLLFNFAYAVFNSEINDVGNTPNMKPLFFMKDSEILWP